MKKMPLMSIAVALTLAPSLSPAEEARSAAVAVRLVALLDEKKLESFAAEDPRMPGRFGAVLYIPRVQILLVAGTYSAPALLRDRIQARDYRQVYVDLSTAAAREGRLFVEDLGAPGLHPTREDSRPFDIIWRDTTRQVNYDGDWKAQRMSESDYRQRFQTDDAEYAAVLQGLLDALTASVPAAPAPADLGDAQR
jgi:hypothetical protein